MTIAAFASRLADEIGQARWAAWLKKQRLDSTVPTEFSAVLDYIVSFVDPIILGQMDGPETWDPEQRRWRQ